jgi:multiple sugar transport system substrate-binding protein/putative aldouronate transport system substrate-binding protein
MKRILLATLAFLVSGSVLACAAAEEFLTIDVFSSTANYQGIQGGWFGEVVSQKFNMRLNIIAPNVAGGGSLLYETRSSAGNLGDIVMIGAESGQLADAVDAGLLLDMTAYADLMPHVMQYTAAIAKLQKTVGDTEGIYAIPSNVSSLLPTDSSDGTDPVFGPYLRWDLYAELGYPEIGTLEDLLPILKQMQELEPETVDGNPTYAFTLFGDWDSSMMVLAKQPACFYGYDEVGFLLNKADGTDTVSILSDDSPYLRSLRFYFEANQMGLVDPESTTQNWDSVWQKYVDGQILFSPWPWLGPSAYNTLEHLNAGKGFMLAAISDMTIYSTGANPSGGTYVVGIGSQTKDPERMARFIDWLYSPEGILMSTDSTGSTGGPEGLTWEQVDGEPVLTDFGITAILEGGASVPEEWGGGSWSAGISQLNFVSVIAKDINPDTGFSYDFRYWDSYLEYSSTPVHADWRTRMGAMTSFEYLEDHDMILVAPGTDYIAPAEPAEIANMRANCREVIVSYSWEMVFAEDQAEFDALWVELKTRVANLGYATVLEYDLQIAGELNQAREAVRLSAAN